MSLISVLHSFSFSTYHHGARREQINNLQTDIPSWKHEDMNSRHCDSHFEITQLLLGLIDVVIVFKHQMKKKIKSLLFTVGGGVCKKTPPPFLTSAAPKPAIVVETDQDVIIFFLPPPFSPKKKLSVKTRVQVPHNYHILVSSWS